MKTDYAPFIHVFPKVERVERTYPPTSTEILGRSIVEFVGDCKYSIDPNDSWEVQNALKLRYVDFNYLRLQEAFICGGFSSLFDFESVMTAIRNNISEIVPGAGTFEEFSDELEREVMNALREVRDARRRADDEEYAELTTMKDMNINLSPTQQLRLKVLGESR